MDEIVGKEVGNKQIILKGYREGDPKESDMELRLEKKIKVEAPKGSAAFLVKNLYLSCDPYMRGRMRDSHVSYLPPFVPGSAIEGFGVSKVIDSDDPRFKPGDIVSGFTGWEEYSLIDNTEQLRKVEPDDDIPLSYHIGLLGMPGFTAYAGFYEVCSPKENEHGCYVVGSAGSNHKVDLLKNELGFDEAFNYKEEPDLDAALKKYFPQGIDIYFENVGGAMLDAVLLNMRVHGRIAVCGMVSQNGISSQRGIRNIFSLIPRRIKMQGLLQRDYLHLFPKFVEDVSSLYKQGKITYLEDMKQGLESAPAAFVGLFSGKNVGKQVICVSPA